MATTKTALDSMQAGLREKGYRTLVRHEVKQSGATYLQERRILAFTLYTNGRTVLVLQEHAGGGCELYKPVVDTLSIAETIAAIPEAE